MHFYADHVQTTFSTAANVEITAVVTGTTVIIAGVLAGVLVGVFLLYCIGKHRSQSSKPEPFSQQQQATVPQQRSGPEYEEVVELREMAYGPAQSIELKPCEAYVPVQH